MLQTTFASHKAAMRASQSKSAARSMALVVCVLAVGRVLGNYQSGEPMEILTSLANKKALSKADLAAVRTALSTNDCDEMHLIVSLVEKHQLADVFQKELLEAVLDRGRADDVRRFACRALGTGKSTVGAFQQIISRNEVFLKKVGYSILGTAN